LSTVSKPEHARLVCLFGPTAVGKTDTLIHLFQNKVEIINADALQVYRHMDIGTAKPCPELLQRLPHHLIDVVTPDVPFNVGRFVGMADLCVRDILQRGARPVLSGGTPYYIRSFAYGLSSAPPSDPDVRRDVLGWMESIGAAEAYRRLAEIDPEYAVRITAADVARIARAWEVFRSSGRPLSSFTRPGTLRSRYRFLFVGLRRSRSELNERMRRRVEGMFRNGLVDEVKELLGRGYSWDHPGLKGIGYREFARFRLGCLRTDQLKELIVANTRRYAKRQMTFFRSLPNVRWYGPGELESLEREVRTFWGDTGD